MSKPVVSVAAMMLYEEGYFLLDDPVLKYIPEFKNLKVLSKDGVSLEPQIREMTIQDLLRHTSGLTYGFLGATPVDEMYKNANIEDRDSTLKEMIQKLKDIPLLHQPGTHWEYSISTDVLGYLIEVVSGNSLDQFLEDRIFTPLGMKNTGFYVEEKNRDRVVSMYGPSDKGGIKKIQSGQDKNNFKKPDFLSGGAGLFSTPMDYMRFAQMLLNKGEYKGKRIIGTKTVEFMTKNHIPADALPIGFGVPTFDAFVRGCGFGLGFRVVQNETENGCVSSTGMYGWAGAADTYFWIDPEEELVGIVMAQFRPPMGPHQLYRKFQVLMYQSISD